MTNPLLEPWPGPYGGVPPWDQMRPDLFPPALEASMAEERREIEAIASSTEPPTFENTVARIELAGLALDRVTRMFSVARESVTTPEYQRLEREWLPKLAAHADAILFNRPLFDRIASIHSRLPGRLDPDQVRLTSLLYDLFVRRGAGLDQAGKQRLSEINQELARRFAEFRAKVLADENTWTVLEDEDCLAGLPASFRGPLRSAADERGLSGKWVIVNTRSSVDPFLTFASRRDLREQVWRRFKSRGDNGDANDTKATIAAIVGLRVERARLLGFETHAHWRMSDTMAKEPAVARKFLIDIWPAVVERVRGEVADMQRIAEREGARITIEPWDYLFYAEKVRKATYDLDQAELKPYFELDNMVSAAIWSTERRFGVTFSEITGTVPVFDPDMRVWEATDGATGRHLALFYLDNFARPGKRSGAWASSWRVQATFGGVATPIASNNNNFVKGAAGEPVLISLTDAETLFHEFGHALHDIFQDVRYRGLSNIPMDFVELPSQLNERWLLTREVLDRFARHYQTHQPMPQSLIDRIERSGRFNQGYATLEYLAAAIVDMELHTVSEVGDISTFENRVLARVGGMPREIALRHRLPHFDHLFGSDSYSAGYYSYLWSDVMAADAWQAFVESGPWNLEMNDRYRRSILADANSIDRAEAYRRFRGRDPEVGALLEARGFSA